MRRTITSVLNTSDMCKGIIFDEKQTNKQKRTPSLLNYQNKTKCFNTGNTFDMLSNSFITAAPQNSFLHDKALSSMDTTLIKHFSDGQKKRQAILVGADPYCGLSLIRYHRIIESLGLEGSLRPSSSNTTAMRGNNFQ